MKIDWEKLDLHGKIIGLLIYAILGSIAFLLYACGIAILRDGFK
jgi:hypothetical protein